MPRSDFKSFLTNYFVILGTFIVGCIVLKMLGF